MRLLNTTLVALSCLRLASTSQLEQAVLGLATEPHSKPVNIAIIGAGAAGSSTAYHLAKYALESVTPINITLLERRPYIGGRSTTVNAYDDPALPVELGASIFVKINKILVDAVDEFDLSTASFREKSNVPGADLAVWDGEEIKITQNGGWWDFAKLWWRYGRAPLQTIKLMKSTVGKFLQIYESPLFPFESLTKVAQDVGLLEVTAATGEQYMRENGITGLFGNEIVQASTRVNYAQNLEYIHGLEAMVCMATDGAMAVEGGNWRIFDQMVKSSNATVLLDTEVTAITRQKSGQHSLTFKPGTSALESQSFDAVVLATPFQFSNLSSLRLDGPHSTPDKIPYVELHVTLFTSPHLLSPKFFDLPADQPAPKVILTTLPIGESGKSGPAGVGKSGFWSISLLRPVTNPETSGQEYLYKIFSPSPVNATFLEDLLDVEHLPGNDQDKLSVRDVSWILRKVWESYPYEYPRVTFEDAKLAERLWYTGGMDSFISTMETNALMGKNVAKLIADDFAGWNGDAVLETAQKNAAVKDDL
ncbi:prenylcysteine lyase like protein [Zymoseptoria brevis]|uniref:Prenylcysteine lyase like protein n=1 Tax=Zymoseptoria brevis TaxID=1047168 RepID=A0A0F4GAA1_9PEZI|nr:prenylcysteine lyase like protein [Zymoseptoria brevis]